jgi:imidazoleglycerol phosphate dehydratase HisB
MTNRTSAIKRETNETRIALELVLDGTGEADLRTGIGFLDHLLTALARHSRVDLKLECSGDLEVDDHHTAEDCALALGAAIDEALGDRSGIARFGWAYAPLDEALARAVVDLSGRPHSEVDLGLVGERLGTLGTDNAEHVIRSLAVASRSAIHVDVIRGRNDHHRAEAAFKALALALRQAVGKDEGTGVPSTKGVL